MADVMNESGANESFSPEEKPQHYTQVSFFVNGENTNICCYSLKSTPSWPAWSIYYNLSLLQQGHLYRNSTHSELLWNVEYGMQRVDCRILLWNQTLTLSLALTQFAGIFRNLPVAFCLPHFTRARDFCWVCLLRAVSRYFTCRYLHADVCSTSTRSE